MDTSAYISFVVETTVQLEMHMVQLQQKICTLLFNHKQKNE